MDTNQKNARIAGLIYFILGITGMFGLMYVPSKIIVEGDAAATAANMLEHETLYRLGVLSNLVCQTAFVFLALALKRLFKNVNKLLTNMLVSLVLVSVPIAFVNTISQMGALLVLKEPEMLKALSQKQLIALSSFFIHLSDQGNMIVEIFWGLWLFPFGLLVYQSGFIPKLFGVLLIIGCVGYLVQSFISVVLPEFLKVVSIVTSITGTIGEIPVMLYLLIKGAKKNNR